jgi:hypothetical protein
MLHRKDGSSLMLQIITQTFSSPSCFKVWPERISDLLCTTEIGETKGMSTPPPAKHATVCTLYDRDFFAWTQETARAIEAGRFDEIDRMALADEVESLGKRDRREVESRMAVIIMHLLKLKYQPGMATQGWHETVANQRDELAAVLADSPSLRVQLDEQLTKVYKRARRQAAAETGLVLDAFPETCEWTAAEVLGEE